MNTIHAGIHGSTRGAVSLANEAAGVRAFRGAIRVIEREIGISLGAQADCCGLGMAQCHLLLEIDARGRGSIGDFATYMELDASTLSRSADSLVKAGLVNREDDPGNRRRQILSLTEEGRRRADGINGLCDSWYGSVLERLGAREGKALCSSLPRLATVMRELRAAAASCCAASGATGSDAELPEGAYSGVEPRTKEG